MSTLAPPIGQHEYLTLSPPSISFRRPFHLSSVRSSMKLKNNNSKPIAFKIKLRSDALDTFGIVPVHGIIPPFDTTEIEIERNTVATDNPSSERPKAHGCLIQAILVSEDLIGRTARSVWQLTKRDDPGISELRFKIYMLPPLESGLDQNLTSKYSQSDFTAGLLKGPSIPVIQVADSGSTQKPREIDGPSIGQESPSPNFLHKVQKVTLGYHSAEALSDFPRRSPSPAGSAFSTQSSSSYKTVTPFSPLTDPENFNSTTPSAFSSPSSVGGSVEPLSSWMDYIPASYKYMGRIKKQGRRPLAYGGFSDVWRCDLMYFSAPHGTREAALKELRAVKMANDMDSEAKLRKMLTRLQREIVALMPLQHPNIVSLIGYCFQPELGVISPWYMNGNVKDFIQRYPSTNRLTLIHQVTKGLNYLHARGPPVVHGDIKSDNVLVDDEGNAVIIDFGLSQVIEDISPGFTSSVANAGNARWLAPELYMEEDCSRTPASDVFAFGCLALEISTGELPYRSLKDARAVTTAIVSGKLPVMGRCEYPELSPDSPLWDLFFHCWMRSPAERPTMQDIEDILSSF